MTKDGMKHVYLFAGGLLFFTIAMPVLDSVGAFIQSAINKKIGGMQMQLEQEQCEHEAACELIKPVERQPVNAVGFQVPDEMPEEDYSAY